MIGNDIVDLKLAETESNWERKGFLEKQFTNQEQKVVLSSKNPFLQVWLFWSMKEAAYKCYTQQYKKRFFAPKKMECKMISKTSGIVKIEEEIYFSKSTITKNYIHTISSKSVSINHFSNLFLLDKKESKSIFLNQKITSLFSDNTEILKDNFGVPNLYQKQKKLPPSISKSHHGNYCGFAILKKHEH